MRERRGKAKVFVDGEFWAEVDAGVAIERGLCEGAAFSSDELQEARIAGERALAMNRALHFLGYRARSEAEVCSRLRRYGYVDETVEEVIGRLRDLGYIDDEEFARNTAREKAKKYGPRRVYSDLRRSGIDQEIVRSTVEKEFSGRSEVEAARSAAARRYNTRRGSDAEARRVYGFLIRRGYSAGVCAQIAREYTGPASTETVE